MFKIFILKFRVTHTHTDFMSAASLPQGCNSQGWVRWQPGAWIPCWSPKLGAGLKDESIWLLLLMCISKEMDQKLRVSGPGSYTLMWSMGVPSSSLTSWILSPATLPPHPATKF